MKIFKIEVDNFRLLKKFSVDIESELSLVIGKNNSGKTSLLSVLEKFLNESDRNKFHYDDFNIDYKKNVEQIISAEDLIDNTLYTQDGIKLRLFINYTDQCNLENISNVIMDLDPDNKFVALGFEYILSYEMYLKARADFREFKAREKEKEKNAKAVNSEYTLKTISDFLKKECTNYFKVIRKSYEICKDTAQINESVFIDLRKDNISVKDIISFKYISARREVDNKEVDRTLSTQTSRIYEKLEINSDQNQTVETFTDSLGETDIKLTDIYSDLFKDVISKVALFGGVKKFESVIEITSNLQNRNILGNNTSVVYHHDADTTLPEQYNGLGYMNLIYMIFQIEILIQEFKRTVDQKPADINLLFIEEPEAHTHPQMQYVFIKNIKLLLKDGIKRKDGENRELQYIITTHSSHIVAESEFDDIKYLKKAGNSVEARNLKSLKNIYNAETKQYQFLKQYLTISRAEIFFAEKVILIEGDTERILMPAMMRKIDNEHKEESTLPLLSQNISIVEVGAHSQIFDNFIEFLGIKTLVITDIDSVKEDIGEDGKSHFNSCRVVEGTASSNNALKHYFSQTTFEDLRDLSFGDKQLSKTGELWKINQHGKLCIVFQTNEGDYHARSFEDAFININKDFIKSNIESFKGLKNNKHFYDIEKDSYDLACDCVAKKTHFALDILYNSDDQMSNWNIPLYIKEGLLWLRDE